MRWWHRLPGRPVPAPVARYEDATFGTLVWSDDDDSWVGEYGGYRIGFDYYQTPEPAPELLTYARQFLGENGAVFTHALAAKKEADAAEFRLWADEFAALTVGTVSFGMSKCGFGCFVDLVGGEPDRWWRVEFNGYECDGFGFDT